MVILANFILIYLLRFFFLRRVRFINFYLDRIAWGSKMSKMLKNSINIWVIYQHFLMMTPTLPGILGKNIVGHQYIHLQSFFILEGHVKNLTLFDEEINVFLLFYHGPVIGFLWVCILSSCKIFSFPIWPQNLMVRLWNV